MEPKEYLKSMLTNLINDNTADAALDLHAYLAPKMREVADIEPTVSEPIIPDDDF